MKFSTLLTILTPRTGLWLAVAVAAFALGGALFGQYVLSWYPCELCIYQRIPYVIILLVATPVLLLRKANRFGFIAASICTLLLFVDAGIAAYHSGVEFDIFEGPSACSASNSGAKTLEELRAEIMGAPLVSCKQAMAYVFGLSLAVWNLLLASSAALLMSYMLLKMKRQTS